MKAPAAALLNKTTQGAFYKRTIQPIDGPWLKTYAPDTFYAQYAFYRDGYYDQAMLWGATQASVRSKIAEKLILARNCARRIKETLH